MLDKNFFKYAITGNKIAFEEYFDGNLPSELEAYKNKEVTLEQK
ncbi:hypothetical protein [uncultured Treponema sp.]|nr:hypothetical protein [uncultured Treponema sp.]